MPDTRIKCTHLIMENFTKLPWFWWNTNCSTEELNKYFDKNFDDDPRDSLYCYLNEIEPIFVESYNNNTEDDDEDDDGYSNEHFEFIDPRTRKRVENLTIDHTGYTTKKPNNKNQNIHLYNKFSIKSALTKEEHIGCLHKMMNYKPNYVNSSNNDEMFNETNEKRNNEYKEFHKFLQHLILKVKTHEFNQRDEILCNLYKTYVKVFSKELLKHSLNNYSLQTAIAFNYDSKLNKKNHKSDLVFVNRGILWKNGELTYIEDDVNFTKMKLCCNEYEMKIHEFVENLVMKNDTENLKSLAIEKCIDVIIPETTLQFLLCSQEFTEIEVLFRIDEEYSTDNIERKTILIFEDILPLRTFNLKNNNLIYEQLFEILMIQKKNDIRRSSETAVESMNQNNELYAVDLNQNYKLIEFNEFIKNMKNCENNLIYPYTNYNVAQWSLGKSNENPFEILTKQKINATKCAQRDSFSNINAVNYSFKLEYKKEFGAEIMTRTELIQEWIRQFLTPNSYTERVRVDIESLEPIMHQHLSLNDIEYELLQLHGLKPKELLGELYNTLSMLKRFPIGNYLLKYNSNNNDKLIIYKETEKKISENDTSIGDFYKDIGSCGINFMKNGFYLPIDSNTITPLHIHYNLLPCCFPHWIKGTNTISQFKKVDDREKNVKKFEKKKNEKLKMIEDRKKLNKVKRQQVKHAKRKQKLKKLKEAERKAEMEFDAINSCF